MGADSGKKPLFTMGAGGKDAERFFSLLEENGVKRLVDIRLHNTSQLAGFTKRDDLAYFLRVISGIEYVHEPLLAPTEELLEDYRKSRVDWAGYEVRFAEILRSRDLESSLDIGTFLGPTVLLCSEPRPERCHRRLVAEYLSRAWGLEVVHL